MSLIADFKVRFPEFDSTAVDLAWPNLDAVWCCYYGGSYVSGTCVGNAILNLIAHLFVVGSNTSSKSVKAVASWSVSGVSESFTGGATPSAFSEFFNTTKYGQAYLLMIANSRGAIFV
jgi:hypothetical protein